MGPAVHKSSGELRLGLTATAAAAVLYGAVVVFGLGPASPFGLSRSDDVAVPVVHVPHDPAASGPALRLPQVSPGPERRTSRATPRRNGVRVSEQVPAGPRRPEPASPSPNGPGSSSEGSTSAPTPAPYTSSGSSLPQTELLPPTLPSPPVAPVVTVPTVSLPPVELLPPLPAVPELPPAPTIQLALP
jgi:hypothetical protein